jgi:catechol 2,3-dioxygenase-like lactoylglutathione lyase family enzyme
MQALEFRFAFFARDLECSVAFYRDTLGMPELPGGWTRPDGKGVLLGAGGTAVIEIYGAPEGATYDGPSPSAINIALRLETCEHVDRAYRQLAEKNVRILDAPADRIWGQRSFVVADPDGIPVHLYCEL